MNITDAADIIGIPRRRDDELDRETQRAAELWSGETESRLIHTHRMAFLDGVQYGLKLARRIGDDINAKYAKADER